VLKVSTPTAAAGVWSCGLWVLWDFMRGSCGVLQGAAGGFPGGSAPEWLEHHQQFYGSSTTPKSGTTHSGYSYRQNA